MLNYKIVVHLLLMSVQSNCSASHKILMSSAFVSSNVGKGHGLQSHGRSFRAYCSSTICIAWKLLQTYLCTLVAVMMMVESGTMIIATHCVSMPVKT